MQWKARVTATQEQRRCSDDVQWLCVAVSGRHGETKVPLDDTCMCLLGNKSSY